ncbi:Uncharacterised protein [Mycobacteroides abscessus subsp. abscessus]|nr:Uncharacterised protein [Mycobacteroides abscessus subsp. abscessus]SIN23161.1 Uncharacterised protein [Mycobacteroides abscessus subsp. abscessus]SKU24489.1 Uncharacterised protein [Mycobacteroides abscessus subsp. abscessus]
MRSLRVAILSPCSAETGISTTFSGFQPNELVSSLNSALMASKMRALSGTRSILLTANTSRGTPKSASTAACRRVCSMTPLRASTSRITSCAVEAPDTVFRVYCTWPGVSARMNERLGVAK